MGEGKCHGEEPRLPFWLPLLRGADLLSGVTEVGTAAGAGETPWVEVGVAVVPVC